MLPVCQPLHVHLWISAVAYLSPVPIYTIHTHIARQPRYSHHQHTHIHTRLSMTHTLTFPKVNGCRQKAACIECILFLYLVLLSFRQ